MTKLENAILRTDMTDIEIEGLEVVALNFLLKNDFCTQEYFENEKVYTSSSSFAGLFIDIKIGENENIVAFAVTDRNIPVMVTEDENENQSIYRID